MKDTKVQLSLDHKTTASRNLHFEKMNLNMNMNIVTLE